jgi:hypothetical protein
MPWRVLMTHDELIEYIDDSTNGLKHEHLFEKLLANTKALRAVVELHKPEITVLGESTDGSYKETVSVCRKCSAYYPCSNIKAIEKELG